MLLLCAFILLLLLLLQHANFMMAVKFIELSLFYCVRMVALEYTTQFFNHPIVSGTTTTHGSHQNYREWTIIYVASTSAG